MRSLSKWLLVCGLILTFATSAQAQRQPGGGGFGGMGGIGGGMNLRAMLATSKPLQEELKMTEEQVSQFKEFNDKAMEAMGIRPGGGGGAGGRPGGGGFGGFGGMIGGGGAVSDEDQLERLKLQVKMIEDRIAITKKVLTKEQVTRLSQLERQQMGMAAFSNEKIAKELKLTDEQKEKIKTVNEDLGKEMQEMFRGGGGGGAPDFQEMQKKMRSLREDAQEKIEKSLTDDQKKIWKDMTGEPYDMSKLAPMFRPKN